jgi:uncharacterized repeat protein (TIGR03803 family)
MKRYRFASITILLLLKLFATAASAAPKFKVLHAFGNGQDGAGTWGSLTADGHGNLFGATSGGGGLGCNGQGCGTVFELSHASDGKWSERILYSFKEEPDGFGPFGRVIFDADGNLYGTTVYGGMYGYGAAFELTPSSVGWTENVIFSFDLTDGCCPYGGLVISKEGPLYGAGGAAFKLTDEFDVWTETVLHRFNRVHGDGYDPFADPILDGDGNIYGTTTYGGSQNFGIVYKLTAQLDGKWKEGRLHDFCPTGPPHCPDGANPGSGSLAMDDSGSIYGTTRSGGCCGGVIFKLVPQGGTQWKEVVLYAFRGGFLGEGPNSGVVRDKSGNLYGTTIYGGSANCDCGVVYKLAPQKNGKWKYTVLHTFVGSDGAQPDANLIIDDRGNLYGTAATGGQYNAGVAFEVTP